MGASISLGYKGALSPLFLLFLLGFAFPFTNKIPFTQSSVLTTLLQYTFWGGGVGGQKKKILPYLVHLQISPGLKKAHLLCVWISFSDHRLLTKRGGRKKDFYHTLFTGQWIFFTIWMYLWNAWVIHYSRFWSMTMGRRNDWWYLFPDFISLILFIPWPVYLD